MAGETAALDRALARAGETVTVRRQNPAAEVTCLAMVRGFEARPQADDLVGNVAQQDFFVILSPTPLGSFGVPTRYDQVVIGDMPRAIEAVTPIRIGADVVRIELKVRGGDS
ncbi:MAG: hypothetical protein AB7P16_23510 [Bradyrhizobium sp.]|uniref:hypothetical protein n=1 Tax=Bradyrhizobium sp. TaxID=376 RepID=UPI003D0C7E94